MTLPIGCVENTLFPPFNYESWIFIIRVWPRPQLPSISLERGKVCERQVVGMRFKTLYFLSPAQ